MITPDEVIMYFSIIEKCRCNESAYKSIPSKNVHITIDLETNEYIFQANCPDCGMLCKNTRSLY